MYPVTGAAVIFLLTIFCGLQARRTDVEVNKLLAALLDDTIGERGVNNKRIINGEVVKSSWPWLVSLRQVVNGTEHHWCGASLLNKRWALTAAHCYEGATTEQVNTPAILENLVARLGDTEVETSWDEELMDTLSRFIQGIGDENRDKEEMAQLMDWMDWKVGAEKIIIHPDYIDGPSKGSPNDIALMKFNQDVPAAPEVVARIQSVTLPEQTEDHRWPAPGTNCTFKGWGCTEVEGAISNAVQMVNVTMLSDEDCEKIFEGILDLKLSFCAGSKPSDDDKQIVELMDQLKIKDAKEILTLVEETMGSEVASDPKLLKTFEHWVTEGGSSLCEGDSGSPLMCEKDGEWVQAGIASFIVGISTTAATHFPNVFTRVPHFVDWINKNMAEN